MNESWIDSIRFSLAAILAASLFGIATLSPLVVRNESFKQLCYEKQLELIKLEAENSRRKLFAQRIENSPELMEQISRDKHAQSGNEQIEQSFDLPEALAIHPDQMLIAPDQSEVNITRKARQFSQSRFFDIARLVADSTTLQNRLLIASLILLLSGIIPATWFHWKFFSQQLRTASSGILSRYQRHHAHEQIPSPHWDNCEQDSLDAARRSQSARDSFPGPRS